MNEHIDISDSVEGCKPWEMRNDGHVPDTRGPEPREAYERRLHSLFSSLAHRHGPLPWSAGAESPVRREEAKGVHLLLRAL